MKEEVIDARNITKYYRTSFSVKEFIKNHSPQRKLALSDLSFSVRKGEVFGVLGPNGSGKTTLIKILSTILVQDSGSIPISGHDYPEEKRDDPCRNPRVKFALRAGLTVG